MLFRNRQKKNPEGQKNQSQVNSDRSFLKSLLLLPHVQFKRTFVTTTNSRCTLSGWSWLHSRVSSSIYVQSIEDWLSSNPSSKSKRYCLRLWRYIFKREMFWSSFGCKVNI